jgi:hypothetical protein
MKRDSKGKPAKNKAATNPRRSSDPNLFAHQLIREMTEKVDEPHATDAEISRVMAVLGRKGGKIGGVKRAQALSKAERVAIAQKAAQKRWSKRLPAS